MRLQIKSSWGKVMICKRCGTENNETDRFCRNCGNEFKQESITTVSLDSNNQKYKKRTRKERGE